MADLRHHCAFSFPLSVKQDRDYIANFAYEGNDAGHILAEPKNDQDCALYLDANFEKAFKIDDVSSVFHYELIVKNGGLNTYMAGEGKGEIQCSEFDGILHEDELTTLPLAVSISHNSEDNFLDVDFAKKVPDLDCKFCDELSGGNLISENHSPEGSNEEVGVSESSIREPRCFTDQCGKVAADEMHGDTGSTCRYERPVDINQDFKCSPNSDTRDVSKTIIVHNTLDIGCSFSHLHGGKKPQISLNSVREPCTSMCTEDDVVSVGRCSKENDFCMNDLSTDGCVETKLISTRQKRLRRPPQRYLDGSPWLKSTSHTKKKQCTSWSMVKDLGVRAEMKHQQTRLSRRASMVRTSNLKFDSDEEYEPDKSYVRKSKREDRRKNNKPWTLDEVVALVNGMSKFGTGQWTAVKKSAFSYSHRTATDIRDKWRNLVKTNCKSSRSRKDDQHARKSVKALPQSLVEQVRKIVSAPQSSTKRGRKLSNGG